ncbi:MAG: ester cyclase [Chloroflexi bacterium]|nr:ester cyclase [Chloroflexota bacterium]
MLVCRSLARVVQVWRAHATHRGPLLNIPASGRSIQVRGASLLTFRDGQLWRALYIWDVAGLLRAIGLLPEL